MAYLLSPAGSPACLIAGVQNGADEIYLGLKDFNARAGAENFTLDSLGEWVRYAHIRGVKIHVTLNTLLTDRELDAAEELALEADKLGVDAFILQDTAIALRLAGKVGAKLHASTQMSVMNIHGVKQAAALGFSRVVPARELPLAEIAQIASSGIAETEVFCHGALCMSYSGQCMLSASLSGRSGNRGTCSQPCRLKYANVYPDGSASGKDFKYMLSPADLCSLPYLRRLTATGVTALKIEGRLKAPEYVAAVTSAYRRALDHPEDDVSGDVKKLTVIFSRGGFCSGHQLGKLTPGDITYDYPGKTGLPCGKLIGPAISVKSPVLISRAPVNIFRAKVRVTEDLSTGDGICFRGAPDSGGVVNVIESGGVRLDTLRAGETGTITVSGTAGTASDSFYKTLDFTYNKALSQTFKPGVELRKVPVSASLEKAGDRVRLTFTDGKNSVCSSVRPALSNERPGDAFFAEKAREIISATGGTPYAVTGVQIDPDAGAVTFSQLKKMRRETVEALSSVRERRGAV